MIRRGGGTAERENGDGSNNSALQSGAAALAAIECLAFAGDALSTVRDFDAGCGP
jgi:hypothetical protein